jgi:pimeloyl-ACP methyl ester carboxylesterase
MLRRSFPFRPALFLFFLATCGTLLDGRPSSGQDRPATEKALERKIEVVVALPSDAAPKPLSGRLFVFTTQRGGEPMRGPNWFSPEPFYGVDFDQWNPGSEFVVDDAADAFPVPLSELPAGKYRIQALLDQDFYFPSPSDGVGNLYSDPLDVEIKDGEALRVLLTLKHEVGASPRPESDRVQFVEYRSELLSEFHGREVIDRVVVVLPPGYQDRPDRRYPVLYEISGFGGTLPSMATRYLRGNPPPPGEGEAEMIRVLMTGECKWGHHVYADSATNGPRGQATIEELIPLVDKKFRTVADPKARFVGGHSSGGWASLWLQVRYPDSFGGVWSTSPDPVDFRDYQQSNLYADPPESIYYFEDDEKKPLARRGDTPIVWYPDFAKMDDCLKRGGQLRSFEAVFSPRGQDGEPLKMWDRKTGEVNPTVVEAWKDYDISLRLRSNWEELGPKLAGKLHVTMGDLDTFYLEGATILLKQVLEDLGSDAQVVILPGASHGSYLGDPEFQSKQRQEMSEQYFKYFDREGQPKAGR